MSAATADSFIGFAPQPEMLWPFYSARSAWTQELARTAVTCQRRTTSKVLSCRTFADVCGIDGLYASAPDEIRTFRVSCRSPLSQITYGTSASQSPQVEV